MRASLPQDDPAPAERRAALAADRETSWRFDPTQRGLPLAARVEGETYSPAYVARVIETRAMLQATRAAAALDPRLRGERAAAAVPPGAGATPLKDGGVTLTGMVPIGSRDHYAALFTLLPAPAYREWAEDDGFFAWQRLAGCNPTHLRCQREADPHLPVTGAHLRAAAGPDESLDRARAEGRLFALDLGALHGLPQGATQGCPRYSGGPVALFVLARDGRFRPVAIQPAPVAGSALVTPVDGEHWRLARLDVQVADGVWAGAAVHVGYHALAAGFQVCAARELAPAHPLRRLLWPHFEMTTAANETTKEAVLGPGGYFDELMAPTREAAVELAARVAGGRSLRDRAPWRDLALRGVDSVSALPEYPYRDDGLPVAAALRRWVDGYLRLWYRDDARLALDPELAGWHRALGAADGAGFADVPPLAGVDDLVDLVTTLLFELTAGHATVNYAGYDFFGWPESLPTARWAPSPGPGEAPTEEDYLRALAPVGVADRMLDLTLPQRQLRLNTLGDGIMALFDRPGTGADDAVAGAVAMHRALEGFNAARLARGLRPVRTGVGINTGTVMLATLGGGRSLKCGVVGDAVNLAARVEGLTRRYEAGVLISDATLDRMRAPGRFAKRRAGRVRVKGREQPLTVYEVIDAEPEHARDARPATLDRHEAAVEAFFAGDFAGAQAGFAECLSAFPGDPLPLHFLNRLRRLVAEGAPPGWDGVEDMTVK